MRNKIFQWLWFKIFRPLVQDKGEGIESIYPKMIRQIKLARLFGGAHAAVAGDSNGAALNTYEGMREFHRPTINISKPGTYAHDWLEWFQTEHGKEILQLLKDCVLIHSNGGNYSIRNKMDIARDGLTQLHNLFPNSCIITIPPVRAWLLDMADESWPVDKTAEQWDAEMSTLNGYIKEIWGDHAFDTRALFSGELFEVALADAVHFSQFAAMIICELMGKI